MIHCRKLPVILPHHLMKHMWTHEQIPSHAVDPKALKEYWEHMECFSEWAFKHPACGGREREHWPLWIYGDDVKFSNTEKLTVVMLGMVLDETKSSMKTHHPLFIIREAWYFVQSIPQELLNIKVP